MKAEVELVMAVANQRGAINESNVAGEGSCRKAVTSQKVLVEGGKPALRATKSDVEGGRRKRRKFKERSTSRGLLKRQARGVEQEQAEERVGVGKCARTGEGAKFLPKRPPVPGQELHQQLPLIFRYQLRLRTPVKPGQKPK